MARIQDVARQAGVSVATVSRALAGLPSVSEAARRKVQEAAQALDYRPDHTASRLRSRRSTVIGLVVSDIRNTFFTELSRAVEDLAFSHHLSVILCNTDEDAGREEACLKLMADEAVAGVILSPSQPFLARFQPGAHPFPVVLVDRYERGVAADAVLLDNLDAASRLTVHLLDNGHRDMLFLYGAHSATGRQRLAGHAAALSERQQPVRAEGVAPRMEAAREAALAALRGAARPQALVASSGLILLGILEAVRELGLAIPGDLAVAGFDDMPWTRLVQPGLTVIAQPTYAMGREALGLLLQRIADPAQAVRQLVLRGDLLVRGSTAARTCPGPIPAR
jgi:LacI family fructose operon transcriptional repressor